MCTCMHVCAFASLLGCPWGPLLTITVPQGHIQWQHQGLWSCPLSFSLPCNPCLGVPSELLMEWPEHL